MLQRWRHGRRCLREARGSTRPELTRYLEQCASLSIGRLHDTPLIAVDLELTGFDSREDRIVAMGWTQMQNGRVQLGSSRYLVTRSGKAVGDSAIIHGITDAEVAAGASLDAALAQLFEAARGRLWVFHHAGLDVAFLRRACRDWAGVAPGFIVLDTLRIEYRLRRRRDVAVKSGDLQLGRVRSRYGLPDYAAHNALSDALAAAELMLAIGAELAPESSLDLARHVKFF